MPQGHTVKLTFNKFNLDRSRDCGDYIEIIYGLPLFSERQEAFCGYDASPGTIRSRSQFMMVNFRSDNLYLPQYKGFEATFTAETDKNIPDDPKDDINNSKYLLSQEIINIINWQVPCTVKMAIWGHPDYLGLPVTCVPS